MAAVPIDSRSEVSEEENNLEGRDAPRHGFQGDRGARRGGRGVPEALSIAISREAGARGSTIAGRVARKLGWQVFDQELLEYIAQEGTAGQEVTERLSSEALAWSRERLDHLTRELPISDHPSILSLARIVLALAAQGEAILVGRGAGCLLPTDTTLNVRIIAPLADRIAYMSQWLRLTRAEAAKAVESRDAQRALFLSTHFHRQPADPWQYDLLLNSSLLGEELCAELIAQAARAKAEAHTERVLSITPGPA